MNRKKGAAESGFSGDITETVGRFLPVGVRERVAATPSFRPLPAAAPLSEVILISDDYARLGLKKGYIGVVVENHTRENGLLIVDFFNPVTGEEIVSRAEIREGDFRLYTGTAADLRAGKEFRALFQK